MTARAVTEISEATNTLTGSAQDYTYALERVAGELPVGPLRMDLNAGVLGDRRTSLVLGGSGTVDETAGIVYWPTEIWTVTHTYDDGSTSVTRNRAEGLWHARWAMLHSAERISNDYPIYELRNFSGGATQITKTYDRVRTDLGYDAVGETTTVKVTHTPE